MADDRRHDGWLRLGGDRLLRRGDRLVVVSKADMPDWAVREFRRPAVHYGGERYYVEHRERRQGVFEYALRRWPEDLRDTAGSVITYDADYVAARDARRRAVATARRAEPFLQLLYPVIGLLPGWVKERLADRYGVREDLSTQLSLWLELAIVFICLAFLAVRLGAAGLGRSFGAEGTLGTLGFGDREPWIILVILPDLAMRYARIVGESPYAYGFWEWLWHRL